MKATLAVLIFIGGVVVGQVTPPQKPAAPPLPAERVSGIGGVFFKSRDPKALMTWYRDKLGIEPFSGMNFSPFRWRERDDQSKVGTTVWSLFDAKSSHYPGPLMINYRVRNLDRMLAQLKSMGVQVEAKVVDDFNGRFAWAFDAEGNKIELWEPKDGY